MATIDFTHACGHQGACTSYTARDARSKVVYAALLACPQCRWDAEHVEAAEQAQDMGLPTLKGAPEQVAIAEVRRLARLPALVSAIEAVKDRADSLHWVLAWKLEWWCGRMERAAYGQTEAAFWIDGPQHVHDWLNWMHAKAHNASPAPAILALVAASCGA